MEKVGVCEYCKEDIFIFADQSSSGEIVSVGYQQILVCKSPSACFSRASDEDMLITNLGIDAAELLLS
jgi:hypothetical protein